MSINASVLVIDYFKKITRLLGKSMIPIRDRAFKRSVAVYERSKAVRICFITDATVGYVIPILQNSIVSPRLLEIFEEFTVKRYKFRAGNHILPPIRARLSS
jgi:hypothetical protein